MSVLVKRYQSVNYYRGKHHKSSLTNDNEEFPLTTSNWLTLDFAHPRDRKHSTATAVMHILCLPPSCSLEIHHPVGTSFNVYIQIKPKVCTKD